MNTKKTGIKKILIPSDELIIDKIGESIENFDISTIEVLVHTQKKNYKTE